MTKQSRVVLSLDGVTIKRDSNVLTLDGDKAAPLSVGSTLYSGVTALYRNGL